MDAKALLFKQSLSSSTPEFKVLLLGDGNVGKSSFIGRHIAGNRDKRDVSTVAATIHPLVYFTSHGPIKFNVWDTNGQEKVSFVRDSFYTSAHCAIILFDVTASQSYQNLSYWHSNIVRICGNIPTVICGNKIELETARKVKLNEINFPRDHNLHYFEVSALASLNFVNPFLCLARKLSNQRDLYFLEKPILKPREVDFTPPYTSSSPSDGATDNHDNESEALTNSVSGSGGGYGSELYRKMSPKEEEIHHQRCAAVVTNVDADDATAASFIGRGGDSVVSAYSVDLDD